METVAAVERAQATVAAAVKNGEVAVALVARVAARVERVVARARTVPVWR